MRIRSIKPDFFHDDRLAELEPLARLLFAGLWCCADSEGRLEDRPKRIKVDCLPYDDCDVDGLLGDLEKGGFILRYEVDGERYILVRNFLKHQRISGKEATAKSTLPPPPKSGKQRGSSGEAPVQRQGSSGEGAVALEGKGREGKGREEDPVAVAPAPAATVEVLDQYKTRTKPKSEKPTASRHAPAVALLVETWKATVGTAYPFQGGRDGAAVSKLLTYPDASDEEIRRRFAVYLSDAFNVKQASLAHFVAKWAGCVEAPAARRARDPRFGSARAEDQHHPAAPGPMWFPGDPEPKPEGMP